LKGIGCERIHAARNAIADDRLNDRSLFIYQDQICRSCTLDDIEINQALVRALLQEQHPDLADLKLREVAGGWDNQMWRLGGDLAVRMPRTPRAPSLLRTEQRWLPLLASSLPLPVPVPVRVGEPSPSFPATWSIVRWVGGQPADSTPISSPEAAGALARFLEALHRPAPGEAPANPNRGVALQALAEEFEGCLPLIADGEVAAGLRGIWAQALAAPAWDSPPVWLHGDLHPANVVVADGMLSGVIDFGEMCAGDPATDLSAAWLLLPDGSVPRVFDVYPQADEATIVRARGWAALRCLHLISIGQMWERGLPGGKQTWGPAGRSALGRVLAGS
jgi:aminoglycoside phosphotransferase (APT) family kinase protein